MKINFSIIIPTFNRKKYLIDTLNYINNQSIKPLEIIVVDASHNEYQLTDIDCQRFSLLRYYKWKEYGNICKQRNYGIELSSGNYILFLDDDVNFNTDLIANYYYAFNETNADGISGLVETKKYYKGSKAFNNKGVLYDAKELNIQACDYVAPTKLICTASFAIKKSVLQYVNGFDELQRGTYDDIELGFRLAQYKFKIIHHPFPIVFHIQAAASGARDLKNGPDWGIENQTYFMLKHLYFRKKHIFLVKLIIEILRPSRSWKKPKLKIIRAKSCINAYTRACKLLYI